MLQINRTKQTLQKKTDMNAFEGALKECWGLLSLPVLKISNIGTVEKLPLFAQFYWLFVISSGL